MSKKRLILILSLFIVLMSAALITIYFYFQNFAKQPLQLKQDNQIIELKRGMSVFHLAKQLEQDGIISNAHLLPYLVKMRPDLREIKSGTYQLYDGITVEQFLALLVSGKELQLSIKFVEGRSAKEWFTALENSSNIEYELSTLSLDDVAQKLGLDTPLEGWLFPETYNYAPNTSDLAILKRAHQKMQTTLQRVWDNRDENLPYETPYQLLIMASIIEKETSVDAERTKVASVFINRLKYKMKLQTDPTVIYGMGEQYQGKIGRKDLQNKENPYNTYVISGLPPTPITMPSLASLEAAAHPEKTNYLYFVADGQGGHVFSTSYNAHKKAVDDYWRLMRQSKPQ